MIQQESRLDRIKKEMLFGHDRWVRMNNMLPMWLLVTRTRHVCSFCRGAIGCGSECCDGVFILFLFFSCTLDACFYECLHAVEAHFVCLSCEVTAFVLLDFNVCCICAHFTLVFALQWCAQRQ